MRTTPSTRSNGRRGARQRLLFAVAVSAGLVLAACGDDDGATVRDLGGEGSESGSTSGSGSETASGSGSASAVAAECSPVGEDLESEAATTVAIELADYEFVPESVEVEAGVVTFEATNVGGEAHELAFLPGGGEVPFTEDGAPDEEALAEMGAFELEAFAPGQDCEATYDLEPGEYTLFCIVTSADGETHYEKGMAGSLTVS